MDKKHKGGLGRGIANLIPNATQSSPPIGHQAADIVFGAGTRPKPGVTPPARPGQRRSTGRVIPPKPAGDVVGDVGASFAEIAVADIVPNPSQPRREFAEEPLKELAHSIKEFGLMQPIVVRPKGNEYELIMGERRLRAARMAGVTRLPAIVRHTDDADMLRDALVENIHRVQLNPLEEASAYKQLLEDFGVTHAELADKLGRSRPAISNTLRLLDLPVPVQRRVAAGVLSAGHARALLGVKVGAEAQERLAARIVAEGLSVRATEEAVTLVNGTGGAENSKAKRQPAPSPQFATRAAQTLADELDTKVVVRVGKKNRGKIVVEFSGEDDLNRIVGLLGRG